MLTAADADLRHDLFRSLIANDSVWLKLEASSDFERRVSYYVHVITDEVVRVFLRSPGDYLVHLVTGEDREDIRRENPAAWALP